MSELLHNLVIHVDYRGNRIASIGFTSPSPTADVLNIIPEGCTLTFENKGPKHGLRFSPEDLAEIREQKQNAFQQCLDERDGVIRQFIAKQREQAQRDFDQMTENIREGRHPVEGPHTQHPGVGQETIG